MDFIEWWIEFLCGRETKRAKISLTHPVVSLASFRMPPLLMKLKSNYGNFHLAVSLNQPPTIHSRVLLSPPHFPLSAWLHQSEVTKATWDPTARGDDSRWEWKFVIKAGICFLHFRRRNLETWRHAPAVKVISRSLRRCEELRRCRAVPRKKAASN